jgi:uncharacterized protein (TIGR03067 family)
MSATRHCPQCGAEVRPDAPEGLCPECLLKEAMKGEPELGQEHEFTADHLPDLDPPSLQELAQQFPQLEVVELLGHGGMGIVYKARQRKLDRFVALKILPAGAGRDPAFAERFAREARALAKLTHPSIVTVFDFGESDGRFYLLMEFVDGLNLRQLLRERRLKPEEALKIVPQICEALQYAHEQGVIHRDIKPENILLDKKGHVKIADFGLAKLLGAKASDSALTGSQQIMGTLHYMAPEQMERPLTVDHRADIYSLGVVFYEMLTGELPLGRFAPPSQKVQVDVRLDEVVLRALEKEPERRYRHASDVKQEVETITHTSSHPERPAASSDMANPLLDAKSEELERLVVSLMPDHEIAAIRAYRERMGVPLDHAAEAVEAIARRHGIAPRPVPVVNKPLMWLLGRLRLEHQETTAQQAAHVVSFIAMAILLPLCVVGGLVGGLPESYALLGSFACIIIAGFSEGLAYITSPTFAVHKRLLAALRIASDDSRDQTLATVGKDAAAVKASGVVMSALAEMRNQTLRDETASACALTLARLANAAAAIQVANMIQDQPRREAVLKQVALKNEPEKGYQHAGDLKAEAESIPSGKEEVEAIARQQGLPPSASSLLNSPSTCGIALCVLGIAASFVPAVIRHLDPQTLPYDVLAAGQPPGNQRWVPVPDIGMFGWGGEFSWEWASIPAIFLALGLFLIGSHSVRRMAILRALVMLLAGAAILVLDVVRVRPVHGSAESYTTPYIGVYVVGGLAVAVLILGVMALRSALMDSNSDADAQALRLLRRKLDSLWESALSLCVGSRVKGASSNSTGADLNDAHLSSAAPKGEEPVSHEASLSAMLPEADPVDGSQIMSVPSVSIATSALPHEDLPKAARFAMKVIKAMLLTVFTCCLFLFLSYSEWSSGKGHRIEVGFPSPWFEAEKWSNGFEQHVNLLSWSWAIAALGAVSCYLYGAIRRREVDKLSALEKLESKGCLLWLLIVLFAFIIVAIRAIWIHEELHKEAVDALASMSRTVEKEQGRIQGTWVAVSAEASGRELSEAEVKRIAMTFQRDGVKGKGLKKNDEEEEGTFRLDPTQKPKRFDLAVANQRMPGIYMLEDDSLTICFNQNEAGERPKTFATDRETELSLIVLKRQRP